MTKLLAIVGPTASGKSELAVSLAKKYNGEIISCDSRQIYRGLDIGTGKIPGKWHTSKILGREKQTYIYKGVIHHCIDYVNPKRQYSAALFARDAKKAIADISRRGKLPILCGGTAHWMDTVAYDQQLPDIKPNPALRKKLEKLSTEDLFARISRADPERAKTIDRQNRHRLIRALEIIGTTGEVIPPLSPNDLALSPHEILWLGIKTEQDQLYKKIDRRLKQRLKAGMVNEVRELRERGLSWKRLESFGLEYKFVALYLQSKLSREEMLTQLSFAIKHYSKRQLTWWKRNKNIHWIKPSQAPTLVEKFLK